jgi:hypothetical protein
MSNSKFLENWCDELSKLPVEELGQTTNELIAKIIFRDNSSLFKLSKELEDSFQIQVINKRVPIQFDYVLTDSSKLIIILLVGTLGELIMFLTYIQYICKQRNIWKVTPNFLLQSVIPDGFWSKDILDTMWNKQKLPDGTNAVDHFECMESIKK